jgi:hypothetical protein
MQGATRRDKLRTRGGDELQALKLQRLLQASCNCPKGVAMLFLLEH